MTRRAPALVAVAAAALTLAGCGGGADAAAPQAPAPPPTTAVAARRAPAPADPGTAAPTPTEAEVPSDQRSFERVDRITGALTPKSVVASGGGLVVAQNMVYTHTVSVFGSDGELLETVDDTVTPAEFGYEQWDAPVRGGPVEAAFSPDRRWLWVSNYSMTGPGFGPEGSDQCTPGDGTDDSFLYRIDTKTLTIHDLTLVGAVPKYVEVTPDGRYVLVTNWCSWDLSVVDVRADGGPREVARVPIGRYPRGIVVSPDSRTAYVAVMGASHLAVVDLDAAVAGAGEDAITRTIEVGRAPRHLNAAPDGRTLYVTVDHVGTVAKVDAASGEVLGEVRTGRNPRSSALSPDGTALFVVNYSSDTVSRVRTSDMTVLETIDVDHHPIGITYDPVTDRVWVASYAGSLTVLADRAG